MLSQENWSARKSLWIRGKARGMLAALLPLVISLAGCAARTPPKSRSDISRSIESRTGHGLADRARPEITTLPEGVSLQDGLTENEAVAIALWNNAAFQADIALLGFARADLIEAGVLRNPILIHALSPWAEATGSDCHVAH